MLVSAWLCCVLTALLVVCWCHSLLTESWPRVLFLSGSKTAPQPVIIVWADGETAPRGVLRVSVLSGVTPHCCPSWSPPSDWFSPGAGVANNLSLLFPEH